MTTKITNKPVRLAVAACLVTVVSLSLGSNRLEAAETDCNEVLGTYLTTISDREGVFSSRGLITFAPGGVLIISDSSQGGVPGMWDPFGASQGAWGCLGVEGDEVSVGAVGLNFVLPGDGRTSSIARVDYKASLDTKSGTLSGNVTLHFTADKDLEAADPIRNPGTLADEFQFDGKRVIIDQQRLPEGFGQ